MGHGAHPHLGVADDQVLVGHVVEGDAAAQLVELHREVRRAHEVAEHLSERLVALGRAVDVELRTGPVGGGEERQPLDVVPVDVGDQCVAPEATVEGLGLAESAQAGTEVEHDRVLARHPQRHAGRVAAVALRVFGGAGTRPAHSVEFDVHRSP
jgi:hypothetical protein